MRNYSELIEEIIVEGYNNNDPFVPMLELAKFQSKLSFKVKEDLQDYQEEWQVAESVDDDLFYCAHGTFMYLDGDSHTYCTVLEQNKIKELLKLWGFELEFNFKEFSWND